MVNKSWRIITRPLLETILNNHAQNHRVPQPLILHGPRGVGKTTLILKRLLKDWNKGPNITGYVDFAESIKDHHPQHNNSFAWASWSTCDPPTLSDCKTQLETCLESLTQKGIQRGTITSSQIFSTLNKWHRLDTALRRIILQNSSTIASNPKKVSSDKVSSSVLWDRAVFVLSAQSNAKEIDEILGLEEKGKSLSTEEASYFREAFVGLRLAKEVIKMLQGWRANAIAHLNRTGGFSRSLANSCTDWPCLLLELLSKAVEIDYFQPKLVLNNIEVLKNAILTDDAMVPGPMYHDSLIWRIIALGANERCLPVMLVTSNRCSINIHNINSCKMNLQFGYPFFDNAIIHTKPTGIFGFPDVFISSENFGWTPLEAKMHMIDDYFTQSEWMVIVEVLGPNPRHLFELYALKQSTCYKKVLQDKANTFEDIVDAYLAYLQVPAVNPAMDKALGFLQKFVNDAKSGKIPKDRLRFGAPWRHPPKRDDPTLHEVNYLGDHSFEIFDDPCTAALLEVGLLYAQRDPSFIRPVSRGIQRCLARWLVHERMKMGFQNLL